MEKIELPPILTEIVVFQCREAILFTLRTEHPEKSKEELEEETDRILELYKVELEKRYKLRE